MYILSVNDLIFETLFFSGCQSCVVNFVEPLSKYESYFFNELVELYYKIYFKLT